MSSIPVMTSVWEDTHANYIVRIQKIETQYTPSEHSIDKFQWLNEKEDGTKKQKQKAGPLRAWIVVVGIEVNRWHVTLALDDRVL